ncbi:sugar ABC transporter permease [Pseudoprimorskyibacter insulae]|uniref:Xylose transport system permease protein XylH n=1 Tax=Pseudoprimorskyibacter insulae TaxID=1695997 RepID=A0A2R8AXQ4_9RHOB|nr:sugar ABC transporter permease [Pseudoprimorskyibacter insulae]SPF80639.1 Xylose transport system permease protein XylH [Pseudoprimorskyibacter insulae]
MSDASQATTQTKRSFVQSLELDMRLMGMIGAFILIAVAFNFITGGNFLSPRNIFNLTIQTVSVAIMATGMVFVIVTRHIDLSVGAVLAICSAIMAMTQARWLPGLGIDLGSPLIAPIAILIGLAVGTLIGAFNGWLIGYQGIPAFIVTLGGFLIWRYAGWYLTQGQTIAPLNETFILFGGSEGTLGEALSWVVGILAAIAAVYGVWAARQSRIRHEFPTKPLWAEFSLAGIAVVAILGFVATLNAYSIPKGKLRRMFEARGEVMPDGFTQGHGLPISVLILILVAVVMTIVARKTRLGRYIFATGGNPDAAELSGINTRLLTVKVFAIMGFLCALSAVVAQARLQSHANDIGTLDELRVIAAAVIGGTALSGGAGTIYGAILGALIMQSLTSGMGMVGVDSPLQNIVVGAVLVFAVWIDIQYRKRTGIK